MGSQIYSSPRAEKVELPLFCGKQLVGMCVCNCLKRDGKVNSDLPCYYSSLFILFITFYYLGFDIWCWFYSLCK